MFIQTESLITTGYRELDVFLGGFHGGDIVVLASRPGVGKSTLALNIATEVERATEKEILFLSPEMTSAALSEWYVANRAGVDIARLRDGSFSTDEWERIKSATGGTGQHRMIIDDTFYQSIASIENACRHHNPGLVVIDNFCLMVPDSKHMCATVAADELSRGIKGIAKGYNIPILVLTQLDRAVDCRANKTPTLSDLNSSGSLEYSAAAVLLLHRPSYYDPAADERDAHLLIVKNRYGKTGSIPLIWQRQYQRFIPGGIRETECLNSYGPLWK